MKKSAVAALALASALCVSHPGRGASRSQSRKSPHVEITASARVETPPRRSVHSNGRTFLEFEVVLIDPREAEAQPADADRGVSIDTAHRIRVVHDVSCGGEALSLSVGDRLEIQGEYVHIRKGGDLIHFTHAASGRCGRKSGHPDGFLRKAPPPTPAPPRPASLVPDQPYVGTPRPVARPYAEILRLRESGQSNETLLAKVRNDNVRYSLSTFEIQKLRAAGVSEKVIEAMLASGRAEPTPTRGAS